MHFISLREFSPHPFVLNPYLPNLDLSFFGTRSIALSYLDYGNYGLSFTKPFSSHNFIFSKMRGQIFSRCWLSKSFSKKTIFTKAGSKFYSNQRLWIITQPPGDGFLPLFWPIFRNSSFLMNSCWTESLSQWSMMPICKRRFLGLEWLPNLWLFLKKLSVVWTRRNWKNSLNSFRKSF